MRRARHIPALSWAAAALLLLAACSPQKALDQATRNAAADVVRPVISREMPAGPAAAATECVLDNASMPEIRALARDYGVEAGTQTVENIRNIALRPGARACLASRGLPQVADAAPALLARSSRKG